jgi:hypothetical protein
MRLLQTAHVLSHENALLRRAIRLVLAIAGTRGRHHVHLKVVQQGRINGNQVVFGERMLCRGKDALADQGIEPFARDREERVLAISRI